MEIPEDSWSGSGEARSPFDREKFEELSCTTHSESMPGETYEGTSKGRKWIDNFVGGHEYYVRVTDAYLRERFNLTGLESLSLDDKLFRRTVEYLMEPQEVLSDSYDEDPDQDFESRAARILFQHVHARFILTQQGMELVRDKFVNGVFGRCPRYFCMQTPVLPIGLSDSWTDHLGVKLYCPSCNDVYHPQKAKYREVNGAGFGRSFPHNYFMHHPRPHSFKKNRYEPRMFGFRIHPSFYAEGNEKERCVKGWESKRRKMEESLKNSNEGDDDDSDPENPRIKERKKFKKKGKRIISFKNSEK